MDTAGQIDNIKLRVYNDELNPELWDGEIIKEDIRQNLLQIAKDFYAETKLRPQIKDILLLGSSANYNWTPNSDIDVHIVINFMDLGMNIEYAKNYTNSLKSLWNKEHDIHIKNHNVELYIQDIAHKTHALGIYSLLQNKWKIKPNKQIIKLDNDLIKQKYKDYSDKIKDIIKNKNIESIKLLLKDIYNMRQVGLDTVGEFSTENIVFKLLRNKKLIEKLKSEITKIYDRQHSIKEM